METRTEKNQASITALSVASAFGRAVNKRPYLFSPIEEKLIAHICDYAITPIPPLSMNGFFARTLSVSPYNIQTLFFNHAGWPYYAEYILLRKFIVKDKIESAILNGAKQIVFLGGGYDIRAFICAQYYPDVRFYELDRGITREAKLNAMEAMPYEEFGFKNIQIKKLSSATIINENLFYRKVIIKQIIHDAIMNDNVAQIVFLGSGYDIRAIITALNNPGIQVYEIDRGLTRENKLYALKSIPDKANLPELTITNENTACTDINDNLHFLDCDLAIEDLYTILSKNKFDIEKNTLIIAEGLTPYLNENENRDLLKSINKLTCKKNDSAFISYVNINLGYNAITKSLQTSTNELYKFSLSPENADEFFIRNGFCDTGNICSADLLEQLGDIEGYDYYKNSSKPREVYYLLRNLEHKPEPHDIIIKLPEKPDELEESSCLVM